MFAGLQLDDQAAVEAVLGLPAVLRSGEAEMGAVMTLFDHVAGQEITVVCNRIPIRRDGEITGAVASTSISDLLDVARLNQEIRTIRRELEHVIQRAAVHCRVGDIRLTHLDFLADKVRPGAPEAEREDGTLTLRDRARQAERESILRALEQCGGNRTRAAQLLGIDRSWLYSKLRKYQLL